MSKLIIFCFDGTGDDETRSETDDVTDVVKISVLLLTNGDNEKNKSSSHKTARQLLTGSRVILP